MNPSSKEYFDRIGGGWDQMQQRFFSDSVRDKALAVAKVSAGETAADVGSGTGFMTEGLLKAGLSVIAVDQSLPMLAALKRKFPSEDVECRAGTAGSLPIRSATRDHVFANMYLHHVTDPPAAVVEMVRALKPGGTLTITDLDTHEHEFLREEQHDVWLGFERSDVESWFVEAGLTGVTVDCVGQKCCSDSEQGEGAAISIFVASGSLPV